MLICHLYIFFGEASFKVFCLFLVRWFVVLFLSFKISLHILESSPLLICVFSKYFLLVCGLSSHSLDIVFHRAEVLNFNEVQLINYFFHRSCLWCWRHNFERKMSSVPCLLELSPLWAPVRRPRWVPGWSQYTTLRRKGLASSSGPCLSPACLPSTHMPRTGLPRKCTSPLEASSLFLQWPPLQK